MNDSDGELVASKLTKVQVDGLLGRFDHEIEFNPSWRFLIIHGPNGVGKTRLLELIHYTLAGRELQLARLPFRQARFEFDDGIAIEVSKERAKQDPLFDDADDRVGTADGEAIQYLEWRVDRPGLDVEAFSENFSNYLEGSHSLSRLEHLFSLTRIGTLTWVDDYTGERLDIFEVADRFGDDPEFDLGRTPRSETLRSVLETRDVHLIEAQRLLTAPRRQRRRYEMHDGLQQEPTVVAYAQDLSQRLGRALADNSEISQLLDRTFPSRLLASASLPRTGEEIKKQYIDQQALRSRLADISVLSGGQEQLKLPDRDLQKWERQALTIYLEDASKKLATFDDLLSKLELLRKIISQRFLFKDFSFDRRQGFVFSDQESGTRIGARDLSSGEQHELVLFYRLLMRVGTGSLVLIDEPEISLHVSWQSEFLSDLEKISELNSVRFLIATHSPHIIGGNWDRTYELYRAE